MANFFAKSFPRPLSMQLLGMRGETMGVVIIWLMCEAHFSCGSFWTHGAMRPQKLISTLGFGARCTHEEVGEHAQALASFVGSV